MKNLFYILAFVFLSSCGISAYSGISSEQWKQAMKERESECPRNIYGAPDDVSKYTDGRGALIITYTYYCHDNKYIVVQWSYRGNDMWDKSEFVSTGICNKK